MQTAGLESKQKLSKEYEPFTKYRVDIKLLITFRSMISKVLVDLGRVLCFPHLLTVI